MHHRYTGNGAGRSKGLGRARRVGEPFAEALERRALLSAAAPYEAEQAAVSGALVSAAHGGYTGSGYVDYQNATGDAVEFTVQSASAGPHELSFRYANGGTSDRSLALSVNGQPVSGGVTFARTASWSTWGTATATVQLTPGANKVRVAASGQNGPNLDSLSVASVTPPPTSTYQAEAATLSGVLVQSNVKGYTGTGFADYQHASGDFVEFAVDVASGGAYSLGLRYANGATSDRPLELKVDGQAVAARLSFAPTGGWGTWKTVEQPAALTSGRHLVRLTSVGSNGPNLDSLTVTATAPPPATLQAESASLVGAVAASDVKGYTGSGYADFQHGTGDSVEFTFNAPAAGNYRLDFRYANGAAADRSLELRVNGAVAQARLPFVPTGAWPTWAVSPATVSLAAGENKVRLTSIGSNGPNLDSLTLSPADTTGGPIRLAGGVLIVQGGAADDTITVTAANGEITATLSTASASFPAASVQRVELFGGGGNDSISVGDGVPATLLDGGDGNDALTGGGGNDTLRGGAGDDHLTGQGGDDVLDGGAGSDECRGGNGINTLDYSSRVTPVSVSWDTRVDDGGISYIAYVNDQGGGDDGYEISNIRGGSGNDSLTGNGNGNALYGGPGDDTLLGGEGNDSLYGDAGNDRLDGEDDDDTLDGGTGTNVLVDAPDSARVFEGTLIVVGTDADETISVTTAPGASLVVHRGGRPDVAFPAASVTAIRLEGMGGNDTLRLGNADGSAAPNLPARLVGGWGNDTLVGGPAADTLSSGPGINTLDGGPGGDTLNGSPGGIETADYSRRTEGVSVYLVGTEPNQYWESVQYGYGEDSIRYDVDVAVGGSGNDQLSGGDNTTLYGGPGDDTLRLNSGIGTYVPSYNITLHGGPGDDYLSGTEDGHGVAYGEEGDDTFRPHEYGDFGVNGGPGTDTVEGSGFFEYGMQFDTAGTSVEIVYGSDRDDVINGSDSAELIDGRMGNDTINGGGGSDTLSGSYDNDVIDGGAGNDTLDGGSGADDLAGGAGTDTASYAGRTNAVRVTPDGTADDGETGEGDNVRPDVENLVGGDGNDSLTGSAANNRIEGGPGKDTLAGLAGDDTLLGGTGDDTLNDTQGANTLDGGPGVDTVNGVNEGADRYEAESATLSGPAVATTFTGYTGTGYADYANTAGDYVEFTVDAPTAGWYDLEFRYANGAAARTLGLSLNGVATAGGALFDSTGAWGTWGTTTIPLRLGAGGNTVRLVAIGQSGPNLDSVTLRPGSEGPTQIQAEASSRAGAVVSSAEPGFTGTGYVAYQHDSGDWVEFGYPAPAAGTYVLRFRYANGSTTDRPLELKVNGAVARARLSFPPTGGWSVWKTVELSVALPAGSNAVRLTGVGQNGPYLDELIVPPPTGPTGYIRLSDGLLTVEGSAGDDVITLEEAGGRVTARLNDRSGSFAAADVRAVELYGRSGNDSISAGTRSSGVLLDGGDGMDSLTGAAGGDTLRGGPGSDVLLGGAGDDVVDGGTGNDYADGGPGVDTFDYSSRTNPVTVNLDTFVDDDPRINTLAAGGEAGETDAGSSFENAAGGAGNDLITGSDLPNALSGGAGDDTLLGAEGDDSLAGGAGNDRLDGQEGDDVFDGGTGVNTVIDPANSAAVVDGVLRVTATNAPEVISVVQGGTTLTVRRTGTPDANFSAASVTAVWVDGLGGADTIRAGNVDGSGMPSVPVRLDGGGGDDLLVGGPVADTLGGGAGNDTLDGGAGGDRLVGGDGTDTVDYSRRTAGVDVTLRGPTERQELFGSGGETGENDQIRFDVEVAVGGASDDAMRAGDGGTLYGGPGKDFLALNYVAPVDLYPDDALHGGPGDDTLQSGGNVVGRIFGDDGNDTVEPMDSFTVVVDGGPGTDTLSPYAGSFLNSGIRFNAAGTSIEVIYGSDGEDVITGTSAGEWIDGRYGNDTISGGGGADSIRGGVGDDVIDGGDGNDLLLGDFEDATYGGNDTITGGAGDDDISGNMGNDVLTGGAGRDQLRGNDGDDSIFSRDGVADTLDGGAGTDSARRDDLLDGAQNVEVFLA
jgi:Ca2+-binding RTX toxin-like protein